MKNVSAGKKIDGNDIPAPLYLSSSIVKNSELNASSACCAQNDVIYHLHKNWSDCC